MKAGERTAWEVLDDAKVRDLADREGLAALKRLDADTPAVEDRAQRLADLAVDGKVSALKTQAEAFKDWADDYGLKRLSNALVELDRVLDLSARGQAVLHAQALTRFIRQHAQADVETLKRALQGLD